MSSAPSNAAVQLISGAILPGHLQHTYPRQNHLIKKLSVDLLKTYNTINQKYYARRKASQQRRRDSTGPETANPHDDENSDYIVKISERLNGRYIVDAVIGRGSFGRVVKAYDEVRGEYVAVKIVKSKRAFRKQALIEIDILEALHAGDPTDQFNIVRMKDTFIHENHQCIVFELLSYNLYELLRDTKFHGVSLNLIRKFARQLLVTLDYTLKQRGGIIHCDLKPENILLRNSRHSAIKVIDFGSACYQDKKMYTYIQSRFYRAPEVLLGCSYNCTIDMWSLGCILVEMHTGKPLFDGSNARQQVLLQCEVLGIPPARMLESGRKVSEYFYFDAESNSWKLKQAPDLASRRRALRQILGVDSHGPRGCRATEKTGHTHKDYERFEELVFMMLDYDPRSRMTPIQALSHKFFLILADIAAQTDPPSSTVSGYVVPLQIAMATPLSSPKNGVFPMVTEISLFSTTQLKSPGSRVAFTSTTTAVRNFVEDSVSEHGGVASSSSSSSSNHNSFGNRAVYYQCADAECQTELSEPCRIELLPGTTFPGLQTLVTDGITAGSPVPLPSPTKSNVGKFPTHPAALHNLGTATSATTAGSLGTFPQAAFLQNNPHYSPSNAQSGPLQSWAEIGDSTPGGPDKLNGPHKETVNLQVS